MSYARKLEKTKQIGWGSDRILYEIIQNNKSHQRNVNVTFVEPKQNDTITLGNLAENVTQPLPLPMSLVLAGANLGASVNLGASANLGAANIETVDESSTASSTDSNEISTGSNIYVYTGPQRKLVSLQIPGPNPTREYSSEIEVRKFFASTGNRTWIEGV